MHNPHGKDLVHLPRRKETDTSLCEIRDTSVHSHNNLVGGYGGLQEKQGKLIYVIQFRQRTHESSGTWSDGRRGYGWYSSLVDLKGVGICESFHGCPRERF